MAYLRPQPYVSIDRRRVPGVLSVALGREDLPTLFPRPSLALLEMPRRTVEVLVSQYGPLDELPRADRYHRVEVRIPTGRPGWVFPDDPFITYEPKDERWCRALGIGHEGQLCHTEVIKRATIRAEWNSPMEAVRLCATDAEPCFAG